MTIQDAWRIAVLVLNACFLLVVLSNVAYFRRATSAPHVKGGPFVSVIVPARNEASCIARCVDSLISQRYAAFEIIVVDDQSSDDTARIVREIAERHPHVRLVAGADLPPGWLGKAHALSQGVAAARGEILLLTDADTVHTPDSISWAVSNMRDHHADILSGYVAQEYGTAGEAIIVPTMYAMMLLTPLALVPRVASPRLAFAIGQYVAMRTEALDGVGGFASIRDSIVDDMSMAIRMKEFGYRNVFLNAKRVVRCRLYTGYQDAFKGTSRSIYSALGGNPATAVAVAAIVLGVIVAPAASIFASSLELTLPPAIVTWSAVLFATQWAFVTWDRDVPLLGFVLYPFVFLNLVLILAASMAATGFGPGLDWKGRRVRSPRAPDPGAAAEAARLADAASHSGKGR